MRFIKRIAFWKRCQVADCEHRASMKVADDCDDTFICEEHYRENQLDRIADGFRFNHRELKR